MWYAGVSATGLLSACLLDGVRGWEGSVCDGTEWGLMVGLLTDVTFVCLCRCSTHSCKSCWLLQDTRMRSIMLPDISNAFLWFSLSSSFVIVIPVVGSFP